jgi:hypothetical protein
MLRATVDVWTELYYVGLITPNVLVMEIQCVVPC